MNTIVLFLKIIGGLIFLLIGSYLIGRGLTEGVLTTIAGVINNKKGKNDEKEEE